MARTLLAMALAQRSSAARRFARLWPKGRQTPRSLITNAFRQLLRRGLHGSPAPFQDDPAFDQDRPQSL